MPTQGEPRKENVGSGGGFFPSTLLGFLTGIIIKLT